MEFIKSMPNKNPKVTWSTETWCRFASVRGCAETLKTVTMELWNSNKILIVLALNRFRFSIVSDTDRFNPIRAVFLPYLLRYFVTYFVEFIRKPERSSDIWPPCGWVVSQRVGPTAAVAGNRRVIRYSSVDQLQFITCAFKVNIQATKYKFTV